MASREANHFLVAVRAGVEDVVALIVEAEREESCSRGLLSLQLNELTETTVVKLSV